MTAGKWTAPAPATITVRAWRNALTSLGIDPDKCASLEPRDGHLRVELWSTDRLTSVIHIPFVNDPTPESVPMVPIPPAPPTEAFSWTQVQRAQASPPVDPGERR